MGRKIFDFSGWATKNDLKCSDGRTIRRDAFKGNDGSTVPLVWNHQHNDPMNVLGHAMLENRPEGVYAYCTFNDTPAGVNAKSLVSHGDVVALSIYANQLKQVGTDVIHGAIREVSLVLTGANPGATIDVVLEHGEESEDSAIIYTGQPLYLSHAEEDDTDEEAEDEENDLTVFDVYKTFTDEQKDAVEAAIAMYIADKAGASDDIEEVKHADEKTIQEVFDEMSEDKRTAAYAIVATAFEAIDNGDIDLVEDDDDEDEYEDTEEEEEPMAHSNIFENEMENEMEVLSHSDEQRIFDMARRCGSLKEAVKQYSEDTGNELVLRHSDDDEGPTYGIENIDYLFPDYHPTSATPLFIKRPTEWVAKFMGGVKRTPFARLKSIYADITAEEARAKGYVTGARKTEEVFRLLNRTTDPTTVYKKQKLDRDNIQDITFDVIPWLKGEMRILLEEEVATAALVGDGRTSGPDKISETNIRPVWTDDDLFTIKHKVTVAANADSATRARAFIEGCVRSRKKYKGTGNPTCYTTEDVLTDCLLLEDLNGRVIYEDQEKLAKAIRCKEIVTVPTMEGRERTDTNGDTRELLAIIVNPSDYTIGANKAGAIDMFDDFDLNFNQYLYLMETRCSGALLIPYSAIAIELVEASVSA